MHARRTAALCALRADQGWSRSVACSRVPSRGRIADSARCRLAARLAVGELPVAVDGSAEVARLAVGEQTCLPWPESASWPQPGEPSCRPWRSGSGRGPVAEVFCGEQRPVAELAGPALRPSGRDLRSV